MTAQGEHATSTTAADVPRRNWAGNVRYAARAFHRPTSVDELRRLVAGSNRIRAVGSGHSFNRFGDTDGDLVTLAGLPPVVDLDRERGQVTVSGAMRYGDLARHLHTQGYALANLASLPHISVAGAVATATHGSGQTHGNLASAVAGLELVTADGDLLRVDRGADTFAGMVVGLGALGLVTRVTLDVVPTFELRQYVRLDLDREALDEALGSAYSVSVFTDFRSPGCARCGASRWRTSRHPRRTGWAPPRPTRPGTRCSGCRWRTAPRSSASRARGTSGCRTSSSASPRAAVTSSSPNTTCHGQRQPTHSPPWTTWRT